MAATIKQAIQAHQRGDLGEAERLYRQLIASQVAKPSVFQNFGALLREQGKIPEALSIYKLGLDVCPKDPGILANRANIYKDSKPATALFDIFDALKANPSLVNSWVTAIAILVDFDCKDYALHVAKQSLLAGCADTRLIIQILDLLGRSADRTSPILKPKLHLQILQSLQNVTATLPVTQRIDTLLAIAFHCADQGFSEQSTSFYHQALRLLPLQSDQLQLAERKKIQTLITSHSWNMACMLLKEEEFAQGWKLYDYGLRTPSKSPQQWQRALRKPFSIKQVPIWRGEPLEGKHLLVLEEQGIGDSMMFLTLLPTILSEAESVDLIVGERLAPIYRRVFTGQARVWTHHEFEDQTFKPATFAFQTALGSIPQYRFTTIDCYAPKVPLLTISPSHSSRLRQNYLDQVGAAASTKLIGVSWSGGGTKSRVKAKSMPVALFQELLKGANNAIFVSLQYGDVAQRVEAWKSQGIPIIHDPDTDALLDMDSWLQQVAACDAIVSVANTTIHGAGSLNIPTMCLLCEPSDWRWLRGSAIQRSYWYPSVGIARQSVSGDWQPAVDSTLQWINDDCPMPCGPCSKQPVIE